MDAPQKIKKIWPDSRATCAQIATISPTVLLAFSRGKDSVAAWLLMREYFTEIVPYFMYRVPDLSFEEDSLRYYEDYFGVKIMRLPHPSLWRMLRNNVFQSPTNPPQRKDQGRDT